ncbi:hypothetical protein ACEPU5_21370 [Pseudomonas aeruginosa]
MNKANECTCPSGDGSLRHPCPAHPESVELAGVTANLTFINGRPAMCGCQVEYSSGGGEYSDVIYVTLCAKHSGSAILDLVATNRIALTPEYEGQWHADLYLDREVPLAKAEGATPAEAVLALMSTDRIDPEQESVEQAGGDERDFQAEGAQEVPSPVSQEYDRHLISLLRKGEALPGHQEEAADEIERLRDWNDHLNNTVLPNILNPNFLMLMKGGERLLDLCTKDGKFIGVSLNDMKDVFDWMVTHARIAPDHAALAQPSPKCATCNGSKVVSTTDTDHNGDYIEAPCPKCGGTGEADSGGVHPWGEPVLIPCDCETEQAEAERPEVVAVMESNGAGGKRLAQRFPIVNVFVGDELMTVAQHERIVEELRAEIAMLRSYESEWELLLNEHEQQRDAALARVAELEKQEPVAHLRASDLERLNQPGIAGSAGSLWNGPREGFVPLYAAPVAQAQQLNDLDKQCRDDVARALGLRPNQERGFAWSYLLASIKSCVKASGDSAQAQHSVPIAPQLKRALGLVVAALEADGDRPTSKYALSELKKVLAAAPGKEVPQAWIDVQAERRRQVEAEGWTPEHDDLYCAAELPRAAAAYILSGANDEAPAIWPFVAKWWKPRDARANYVRAGALILAEIERLDRAAAPGKEDV